jgi:hypothetical protein
MLKFYGSPMGFSSRCGSFFKIRLRLGVRSKYDHKSGILGYVSTEIVAGFGCPINQLFKLADKYAHDESVTACETN